MSHTIEKIMDRIKNLGEYEVSRDIPEGFNFNGKVPFDIKIKGSVGTFKVLAVNMKEAEQTIARYLEENTQE